MKYDASKAAEILANNKAAAVSEGGVAEFLAGSVSSFRVAFANKRTEGLIDLRTAYDKRCYLLNDGALREELLKDAIESFKRK
jgi:hypothetical protein